MIDLTEEVLEGLTVGDIQRALDYVDPTTPAKVFAGGYLWTPKQIVMLEAGEDLLSTDEVITGKNIVEIGCGWVSDE